MFYKLIFSCKYLQINILMMVGGRMFVEKETQSHFKNSHQLDLSIYSQHKYSECNKKSAVAVQIPQIPTRVVIQIKTIGRTFFLSKHFFLVIFFCKILLVLVRKFKFCFSKILIRVCKNGLSSFKKQI